MIDWYSRAVLAWGLSNTLDASFCVTAFDRAIAEHGVPEIFNPDQGCQFTSVDFTQPLLARGVRPSMDGRGRALDNVFVERLWRTVKYEEVYLKSYCSQIEAYTTLEAYFRFYNDHWPHSAFGIAAPQTSWRSTASPSRLPSTNDAQIHPSDIGPTPAASSSAPVLGVGQGIESAFVSLNLIYPIRCPTIGVHLTSI